MRRARLAALLLAALAACGRPAPAPAPPAATAGATAATAGPPPAPPPIPVAADGRAWVISATSLRREPVDAPRVPGPGGKPVTNGLAVLMRGEPVTLLEGRGDWARVRTSGDEPGWVRRAALLEQDGASVATVLAPADVFERPDLLAASPGRRLPPGALLLVVRRKPPFAEVNAGAPTTAWVLADRLATGDWDVATAKLCEKARWLKRNGREADAKEVLALGRSAFPGAPLLDVLAAELGEPAAALAGPATPAGPAAPSGPPPGPPAAAP